MMYGQRYTYEQLSRAFREYLMERFDGDKEEVRLTIETAERIIPNTLNDYFGARIKSIYDITDTDVIETFRRKITTDPTLKIIDKSEEPSYTSVLKFYKLFMKAVNSNSCPIPVRGERMTEEENESPMAEDQAVVHKVIRTIYLEGDAGEAQTKVYRQRNLELRKACIEYYKTLHEGRIVCECCGFDFRQRYDIEDEYIEVHHRSPFAHTEGEHPVDAIKDLVPLCANCHRMIHHGMGGNGNCMSLKELKTKLR